MDKRDRQRKALENAAEEIVTGFIAKEPMVMVCYVCRKELMRIPTGEHCFTSVKGCGCSWMCCGHSKAMKHGPHLVNVAETEFMAEKAEID